MSAYYGETSDAAREVASQTKYHPMGGVMLGEKAEPDKALMATRERVGMLVERVIDVASRLEAIGDSAFGSRPNGDPKNSAIPVRSGDIGAINDALDTLGAQIARAHDAMTRLEGL